jgi:Family of unknown function (DUF6510)
MDALDGNAIAGQLHELFGTELTTAGGTCARCGATGPIAELSVYVSAGTVARCRSCEAAVMVLATLRGVTRVDLRGMAALDIHSREDAAS